MTTIFISYRREDSAGQAGRLFDRLVEQGSGTRRLDNANDWVRVDVAAADHKARFHPLSGLDEIHGSLRMGRPVLATVKIGPALWPCELGRSPWLRPAPTPTMH